MDEYENKTGGLGITSLDVMAITFVAAVLLMSVFLSATLNFTDRGQGGGDTGKKGELRDYSALVAEGERVKGTMIACRMVGIELDPLAFRGLKTVEFGKWIQRNDLARRTSQSIHLADGVMIFVLESDTLMDPNLMFKVDESVILPELEHLINRPCKVFTRIIEAAAVGESGDFFSGNHASKLLEISKLSNLKVRFSIGSVDALQDGVLVKIYEGN